MSTGLELLALLLGFTISLLSGFLGIGGGIVMAPALLYLPPLLGVGQFDMRQVTGLTITHALFACLSGAIRHDKYRCVSRPLIGSMGGCIGVSALAGSALSGSIANETLMMVFAGLAVTAAVLMCVPGKDGDDVADASACSFSIPFAVIIAVVVGLLGGMVGQGGSFILIPLMLHVLKLPLRVVIGSNLALVFISSLAGFAGKVATGQIPFVPAVFLVAGAFPGAQVGSVFSHRTNPRWMRTALAAVVGAAAFGIGVDVLANR